MPEQNLLYSGNVDIWTTYHSICGAVCVATTVLIVSCAQAQNLFVTANTDIYQFTPDGKQSPFASGLNGSAGPVFNNAGDLFVANNLHPADIYEYTPGGAQSAFASGFSNNIVALAINNSGNLFVGELNGNIYELTPSGVQSQFASGIGYVGGMTSEPSHNVKSLGLGA